MKYRLESPSPNIYWPNYIDVLSHLPPVTIMLDTNEIREGGPAPRVALKDQDGSEITLEGLGGRWVILYFYPKDNTSGCTREALEFSERREELERLGASVLGVSPDGEKSHRNFISKQGLDITLLSDTDHSAIEAYGAWKLKKLYGREYHGVERSTFLIGPEGTIRRIWRKVKVKGHVDEVKRALIEFSS